MTIEFREGRYFAGLWYLEDEPRGNWMGAVYMDPDGTWHLVYRHRYYVDDVMDETSADRKSWHCMIATPQPGEDRASLEARLVASVDGMLRVMQATGYGDGFEVQKLTPRSDDPEVCLGMVTSNKWAHARLRAKPQVPISIRPIPVGQT